MKPRSTSPSGLPFGLLCAVLPVPLAACGDDGHDHDHAAGTLAVSIYGEDFIEVGVPAEAMSDGWAVTFDAFDVTIAGVTAQAGHDADELSFDTPRTFQLATDTGGAGQAVHTFDAPGGVYDHFGYVIDGVTVAGSATDGTDAVTFDWTFDVLVSHSHCEIEVTVDGTDEAVEITIHGDHLLHDDAVAAEPLLAFQAIADADGAEGSTPDGDVTTAELAAVDLSTFERYQVGSLPIATLLEFVTHQATTLGHVDGEGHCEDVDAL